MSASENGTTGLNWEGGDGAWGVTVNGTRFEVVKQGGNWVLWVDDVCHYDRYHFATDAMTEAESLAADLPAPAPLTRADLDWLCVTQRAADNDQQSQLLWVQATLAMSDVIGACNRTARDDAHAAHAQHLVGRLAVLAVTAADAPTTGTPVPVYAERVKDQLMHIAAGGYDGRSLL